MGVSTVILPSCTCIMVARQMNDLVQLPIPYNVSGVAGWFSAWFLAPYPFLYMISPSLMRAMLAAGAVAFSIEFDTISSSFEACLNFM